jgi:hypothetical protein
MFYFFHGVLEHRSTPIVDTHMQFFKNQSVETSTDVEKEKISREKRRVIEKLRMG